MVSLHSSHAWKFPPIQCAQRLPLSPCLWRCYFVVHNTLVQWPYVIIWINPWLFLWVRALFNPQTIQLARSLFLAPMPQCSRISIFLECCLETLDARHIKRLQNIWHGWMQCNIIRSKLIGLHHHFVCHMIWMSIHSQGMSVFHIHVPSHLLLTSKGMVKPFLK